MNAGVMMPGGLPPETAERVVALPIIGKSTSRVGFGTGGLLRIGSARRRQNTLAAALASGVTHFDTAPLYGFGESERALGRFLLYVPSQVRDATGSRTVRGSRRSQAAVSIRDIDRMQR